MKNYKNYNKISLLFYLFPLLFLKLNWYQHIVRNDSKVTLTPGNGVDFFSSHSGLILILFLLMIIIQIYSVYHSTRSMYILSFGISIICFSILLFFPYLDNIKMLQVSTLFNFYYDFGFYIVAGGMLIGILLKIISFYLFTRREKKV